ncbi:MAG: Crp/Fnr family transcriptional regulator [Rhodoferax sp.]
MCPWIDPAVAQHSVENLRAQPLVRPSGRRLDPALVQKIAQRVMVFSGIAESALQELLARADHYPLKAGQTVFEEGEIGSAFYVVLSGLVGVRKERLGRVVELARLGPGECFGEMALVRNDIRSASVVALQDSLALRFDRTLLDAAPVCAHYIYRNIARVLAARLDVSSVQLAEQAAQTSGPA